MDFLLLRGYFLVSNLTTLTLIDTLDGLEKGDFSTSDLCDEYKKRIRDIDSKVEAFLQTEEINEGIPVAIKDIINTKNITTTAASKILENYNPVFDATVIERLKENGVAILGKTNLDEFAMGSSGENSAFKITKNPWDLTRVPGGSSSGSAAAVAADLCVFALGTDTGGSIRQPASLCGVVGLKPSYGRVSRYGSMALASSLDQIGPITKSVKDARKVLEWIQGEDESDSNVAHSNSGSRSWVRDDDSLKGLRVGVPKEYFGEGLDNGVEQVIKDAIKKLEELGAEVVEISLPHTEYAIAVYYIILASEVSSNLARFDSIRFGGDRSTFGDETKRRIMLGTFALSSGYYDDYFMKAAKVRTKIIQDFNEAFEKCDVIVGPVSPTTAWKIGEKIEDPLTMYLSDTYTIPASLAGLPGLSVPCGFSDGLPVGLQILGKYMDDETILDVGEIYENSTDWRKEKSKL